MNLKKKDFHQAQAIKKNRWFWWHQKWKVCPSSAFALRGADTTSTHLREVVCRAVPASWSRGTNRQTAPDPIADWFTARLWTWSRQLTAKLWWVSRSRDLAKESQPPPTHGPRSTKTLRHPSEVSGSGSTRMSTNRIHQWLLPTEPALTRAAISLWWWRESRSAPFRAPDYPHPQSNKGANFSKTKK